MDARGIPVVILQKPAGNGTVAAYSLVVLDGPDNGTEGSWLWASANGTSHPEGRPLTYRWLWGDGTESEGVFAGKRYADNGVHRVTLAVGDGVSTTFVRTTATIRNVDPQATVDGAILLPVVGEVARSPAVSVAPDGEAVVSFTIEEPGADDFVVLADWGDGTVEEVVAPRAAELRHAYAAGVWQALFTIMDDADGASRPLRTTIVTG